MWHGNLKLMRRLAPHQQVLFFLHLCVSVCFHHITYLPFYLCVSHCVTQACLQAESRGWRVPRALSCHSFSFVELSNYRRVQRLDSHTKSTLFTFIFHSFLSKSTLRPVRIQRESYMFVLFLFFLSEPEREREWVYRERKKKKGKVNVILYFFVFVIDATNEEEIIQIRGWI